MLAARCYSVLENERAGPGIRWIPAYRVSLNDQKDEKTAAVSLPAELLNEAEDLIDARWIP
jgi:hypothetical protein